MLNFGLLSSLGYRLGRQLGHACGAVVLAASLAGCSPTPEKLLQQIDAGDAANALTVIEDQLAAAPQSGALQLLAAHARLQACAQRSCVVSDATPELLTPVAALLNGAPLQARLNDQDTATIFTQASIIASATLAFAQLPQQPAAMLVLRSSLPESRQAAQLASLWLPALTHLRDGNVARASAQLEALGSATRLPLGFTYAAKLGAALLTQNTSQRANMLAALRAKPTLATPAASVGQLLPYMLHHQMGTAPALAALPAVLETSATLGPLANPATAQAAAQELARLAADPPPSWQAGWQLAAHGPLPLALQRTSLRLFPNQPTVWQTYLPALVVAAQSHTTLPEFANSFDARNLTGPSVAQLGTALMKAARDLQNRPSLAAPLLQLASQLGLGSQQQAELDQLAQSLIVKAATAKDVTATMALALARPQAAANNRQQVVPLLVDDIRASLRRGQFAQAVSTSILINETLELPVDLAPLVLEEFAAWLKANNLEAELTAPTPARLLQPRELVALDLGALWGFMAEYFADSPDILRGQLNALVAAATGPYGPSTAMHRLLPLFPTDDADALESWLHNAILAALQADATLSGPDLAKLAGQLAATHPGLPMAPMLEGALARSQTAAESRTLWQAATPTVRTIIRAIRPQFAALMNAQDADALGQPDTVASALGQLTEAIWLEQASPLFGRLQNNLLEVAGTYVPLSAAPEAPLAAVVVSPRGLAGGNLKQLELTFLNRLGTLASTNPSTLATTPATLETLRLLAPYNFNRRSVLLGPETLAAVANGGNFATWFGDITQLQFKPTPNGTLLEATLRGGTIMRLARLLHSPAEPLLPNGQYALTTPLEQTLTPQAVEAKNILPVGSILTLQAAPSTQPAGPDFGFTGEVYPLLGTLQHPARSTPISFTGEFAPASLSSAFTFSYPLPSSGQAVRAAVKCQTLGGPITCGAHHLHSPRLAYATLVRGLQTQESLRTATAQRQALNASSTLVMRSAAAAQLASQITLATAAHQQALVIGSTETSSPSLATAVATTSAAKSVTPPVREATAEGVRAENEEPTDKSPNNDATPEPVAKPAAAPKLGGFIHHSNRISPTAPSPTEVSVTTLDFPNPPR